MSNKNSKLTVKKIEDVINEQNLLIFDEQIWIDKDLWKIAEVTYSYDQNTGINTTLFVTGGDLNLEKYKKSDKKTQEKLLKNARKNIEKIIKEKISQIENALNEIELIDVFSGEAVETDIKRIFINSLIEKKDFLNYCLNGIPFEIEKAGFKIKLNENEIKELEEKQYILDTKLFGGNIKDNTEEVIRAYEYLLGIFNENKEKLSKIEQENFGIYLKKIFPYIPKNYKYKIKEKPHMESDNFLNYDIIRDDYILGFNILIESLDKLKHVALSNSNAKSISDGPKGIQFPTTKEFNSMKISRFFKLGNHEVETHNITDHNGKQIIGNLRGANSTEKDEGVSILMEQLFMYGKQIYKTDKDGDLILDSNKVQINSNFAKTLMGEILDNKDFFYFLKLSNKIDPDIISPIDRYYRLKRNNKHLVQHKDTTYTRGLFKTIEYINIYIKSKGKKGIKPIDLFLGKISFEETEKLKKIKNDKIKSGKKIDLIKPLFISDTAYFIVREKLNGEKPSINSEKFYKFIQEKYPIFELKDSDIRKISEKTRKNVYGIVDILLRTIGKQNILKITQASKFQINSLIGTIENQYKGNIFLVKDNMHPSRKFAK